jgi:hypothetical protein
MWSGGRLLEPEIVLLIFTEELIMFRFGTSSKKRPLLKETVKQILNELN